MLIFDQLKKGDRPLQLLAYAVLAGMGLLLLGLWHVQVVSSKRYVSSQLHQSLRTVRLPALRGKIVDRNGLPLVDNQPNYSINLYLEELRPLFRFEYTNHVRPAYLRAKHPDLIARKAKSLPRLTVKEEADLQRQARVRVVSNLVAQVSALVQAPVDFDERRLHRHYEGTRALPWPILEQLTPEQVARFAERSVELSSVALEVQARRVYPQTTLAAHLLGHLMRTNAAPDDLDLPYNYRLPDFKGELGLEALFDDDLRGKAGVKTMLVNNLNYRESEEVTTSPEPGRNVVLTIDLPIQLAAERALRSAGANARGAAVVLHAQSGDILALASSPSFDPNVFLSGITLGEWERLSDPKLTPMVNRATYGAYPPGSIFKIIVGLAALEAGLSTNEILTVEADPQDPAHGHIKVGNRRIRDTAAPGDYDFRRAFKRSSNSYFIHFGLWRAGLDKVAALGQRFHLGERLDVLPLQELSGYFPQPGLRLKRDGGTWFDGDTANLCIGQGEITVTPLQMAVMTAAIANGGKVLWPRLVQKLEPPAGYANGEVSYFLAGRVRDELKVRPQHLEIIREAMLADVEDPDGTGRPARVPGMGVCGKTGTAQVMRGRIVVDHITWFVSFAPYEKPEWVVVVMVESGDSGGGTCAPLARQIYETIQKRKQPSPRPEPAMASAQ
jgi:penicillin-binding protein 2